jgi:predicted polyphosphate/ATP-dependent NAD kinase
MKRPKAGLGGASSLSGADGDDLANLSRRHAEYRPSAHELAALLERVAKDLETLAELTTMQERMIREQAEKERQAVYERLLEEEREKERRRQAEAARAALDFGIRMP